MTNLLYRIDLTKEQDDLLDDIERTFVNLFNQFRWAYVPSGKHNHPINIFRNFQNPKGHDLIEEMQQIKNHLIKCLKNKPGSVWRGLDWAKSFQNWLIRTEPRIKIEDLKEEIQVQKDSQFGDKNAEDRIDSKVNYYLKSDLILDDTEKNHCVALLKRCKHGFNDLAVTKYKSWHLWYPYSNFQNYYEELIRIRIQNICLEEKNIDNFLIYLGTVEQYLLLEFFCQHLYGDVSVKKDLTKLSLRDLHYHPNQEEPEKVEFMKIGYDEKKVYSIRDIRGLLK